MEQGSSSVNRSWRSGAGADDASGALTVTTPLLLPTTTHHFHKNEKSATSSSVKSTSTAGSSITRTGLFVLILLAVQNCSKNLIVGQIMKNQPKFLTSTAVLSAECLKLLMSVGYILVIQKQSFGSIIHYLRKHARHTMMLLVPASAYNLQSSLEYVALAHLNAAMFSVIVQTKLVFTAIFARIILGKKLRKQQVVSLVLLTIGVMMCNMRSSGKAPAAAAAATTTAGVVDDKDPTTLARMLLLDEAAAEEYGRQIKGILATLGIAITSGFASVYTEKFIKGAAKTSTSSSSSTISTAVTGSSGANSTSMSSKDKDELEEAGQGAGTATADEKKGSDSSSSSYGLAYTQVQLAVMSILTIGLYALMMDWQVIVTDGLFVNFSMGAVVSIFMSAVGGLIVASVLKYADSILKGYATALSVILAGVLSMVLFHTHLPAIYFLGIAFVVAAVMLYNGQDIHHYYKDPCVYFLQQKK